MKPLQVGDRVRINCPESLLDGEETMIINIIDDYKWSVIDGATTKTCYEVDILMENGGIAGFERHELISLNDDNQAADKEFTEELMGYLNKTERVE